MGGYMDLRTIWLVSAILGAIVPYAFFLDFFLENGFVPSVFLGSLFADGAAGGFTVDLLITSVIFWIWMFSRQEPAPSPWLFMLLNLTIGLSCALPAYLFATTFYDEQHIAD